MKTDSRYPLAASLLVIVMAMADAAAQDLDHYNPVLLNEFALQKLRDGDVRTARILLERAALLAPEHAGIRNNLDTLKASIAGEKLPPAGADAPNGLSSGMSGSQSGGSSGSTVSGGAISPPPPFPLWQKARSQ